MLIETPALPLPLCPAGFAYLCLLLPFCCAPVSMLPVIHPSGILCRTRHGIFFSGLSWLHDLASLGVLELFLVVSLASWHSLALTSSISLNKVEALPSNRLCCPAVPEYYGLLRLPSCRITTSPVGLIGILSTGFPVQGRVSPVHCTICVTMPLPLRRKVLRCCIPSSAQLPWPSSKCPRLGSFFFPA